MKRLFKTLTDKLKGYGLWLILIIIIMIAQRIFEKFPSRLNNWIIYHDFPNFALVLFGIFVSGLLIGLLKLGIMTFDIKKWVGVQEKENITAIKELPWLAVILVTFLSGSYMLFTSKPCNEPAVSIVVEYQGEKQNLNSYGTIEIQTNSSFFIEATARDNQPIQCHWGAMPPTDIRIYRESACATDVNVNTGSVSTFLTLEAKYPYCDRVRFIPINIVVIGE